MLKFLIISALFITAIHANSKDLVELYRLKGIEQVEKELDKKLQNKEYWHGYLQGKDISKGYYESIDHILVCQKDMKNLKLYSKKGKKFQEQFSQSVFIGKGKGDKRKEGDLKTPVGTYELTNLLSDNLDPFYGPLAFVTSYPNAYDKLQNKNGHGIWIHGLPKDGEREEFTQGCIALENGGIKKLNQKFDFKNSILMIQEKGDIPVSIDDISLVLSQMYQWRESWKNSDIDTYLSFYSNAFQKYDGMNFEAFKDYKRRLFLRNEDKNIQFENINIMPYPNTQDKKMFKVMMRQKYSTKRYRSNDIKELYIELEDEKMKILTES